MRKLYPQNYDAIDIQPEYMPYRIAIPVERPEMLVWGVAMIAAAFGIAPPAVGAGFPGLAGVSDEQYLEAEEEFTIWAWRFDAADDCRTKKKAIRKMKSQYRWSGYDQDLRKQYSMRFASYRKDCP